MYDMFPNLTDWFPDHDIRSYECPGDLGTALNRLNMMLYSTTIRFDSLIIGDRYLDCSDPDFSDLSVDVFGYDEENFYTGLDVISYDILFSIKIGVIYLFKN